MLKEKFEHPEGQLIDYSKLLNFIDSKKINWINYNNTYKVWEIYDSKGHLGTAQNLIDCLLKVIPIFSNTDLYFEYNKGLQDETDDHYVEKIREDEGRLNFLSQAFFNYIWLDRVTNNWVIGDRNTMTPVSYGPKIRECIDNLIN